MTNKQRAKKDSYDRVSNFNTRHSAVVSAIDGYTLEQNKFDAALAIIESATGLQISEPMKDAATVNAEKAALAKLVMRIAGKAAVKADQSGDFDLVRVLSFPESSITALPNLLAVQKCANIRDLIKKHISTLTTITKTDLKSLDDAIAAFDVAKDKPVEHIRNRKALGTGQLPPAFLAADRAMNNMFKLVKSELAANYSAEFEAAKMIIDTGLRRTKVLFTVVDEHSSKPVTGTVIVHEGGTKSCATAANGEGLLESIRNGNHTFTVSAVGYVTSRAQAVVKRGEEVGVLVRLGAI